MLSTLLLDDVDVRHSDPGIPLHRDADTQDDALGRLARERQLGAHTWVANERETVVLRSPVASDLLADGAQKNRSGAIMKPCPSSASNWPPM